MGGAAPTQQRSTFVIMPNNVVGPIIPVGDLISKNGSYIGVTATPARLDLNNTFQNDTAKWVNFPPQSEYTGQSIFFPLDKKVPYRLKFRGHG